MILVFITRVSDDVSILTGVTIDVTFHLPCHHLIETKVVTKNKDIELCRTQTKK